MKKKTTQLMHVLVSLIVILIMLFLELPYLPILISAAIVLVFSKVTGGLKNIGFTRPQYHFRTLVGIAIAMGIVINLTSYFIITPFIEHLTSSKLQLGAFSSMEGNTSVFLFSLMIGWIVGGFAEEIIFRGFLLNTIIRLVPGKAGEILGVVFTSALFGYLHEYQGISGQLLLGTVGLFLGGVFILNGKKLWLNIVLHGSINTLSMTALYLGWIQIG